jgi:hypothetical protein
MTTSSSRISFPLYSDLFLYWNDMYIKAYFRHLECNCLIQHASSFWYLRYLYCLLNCNLAQVLRSFCLFAFTIYGHVLQTVLVTGHAKNDCRMMTWGWRNIVGGWLCVFTWTTARRTTSLLLRTKANHRATLASFTHVTNAMLTSTFPYRI